MNPILEYFVYSVGKISDLLIVQIATFLATSLFALKRGLEKCVLCFLRSVLYALRGWDWISLAILRRNMPIFLRYPFVSPISDA